MKIIPDDSILKKEFTIPFFNMKNFRKIYHNLKNNKKSKIYKRKRKTFAGLLTKNVLTGLFLTAIFAVGLYNAGREYIISQANTQAYGRLSYTQQTISRDNMYEQPNGPQTLSARMRTNAYFNIVLDDRGKYQMNQKTENCHALIRLSDKDGNIIHSSRMALEAFMIFSEDDKEDLFCDTENKEIPELQQLEADYMEMREKETSFHSKYIVESYSVYPEMTMTSAYVNKKEGLFIPHETQLNLVKYYPSNAYPEEILETKSYTIDIPEKDGYELFEFDLSGLNHERIANGTYPYYFLYGFYGTEKDAFDRLNSENPPSKLSAGGMYLSSGIYGGRVSYHNATVYIDNQPYQLSAMIQVEPWNSVSKPLYFKLVIMFLLLTIVIALFDAWRHNVRNQANYRFEDYQKNLTDSLAHDLKTPLMAIGGYVENIMTGNLSADETNKYLSSVMDNISYTDSIITRTLELNSINSINIKKVQCDLYRIVSDAVEKYSLLLDEKNISVHIGGTAEISADTVTLKTIIENLISNAVNYTTENGKISISISDKNLIIKNTVGKKIDVTGLKKPFAKGDKSRSNNSGIGLGLAIAENASMINGFRLDISCSDAEFIAELKF
ncbi:MAG: HAMP domain-containing histidine kinase [Ruminococcus sp.]|nr:HAMP domain-containing histidine kinase [Ruminococcus sp.]